MRRIIYSLEGNIGSGKSTLLRNLAKNVKNLVVIDQPIHQWQNVGKHNLLDLYYQNPERWAFSFQTNAILSRMNQLSNLYTSMEFNKIYLSERSVHADKYIFAKMLHHLNKMNDMEYQLYLRTFDSLHRLFEKHAFNPEIGGPHCRHSNQYHPLKYFSGGISGVDPSKEHSSSIIHKYIYLETPPEKCYMRIKKRNRPEQRKLQFDYIKKIHQLHRDWLVEGKQNINERSEDLNSWRSVNDVLVLNGQGEFETDSGVLEGMLKKIHAFICEQDAQTLEWDNNWKVSTTSVEKERTIKEK